MFEIVEAILEEPIRILAAPDSSFRPGMVGQFCERDGNTVCELSDGSRPIGIIDDFKIKGSWFDPVNIIHIWTQRMVFRTDEYERGLEYKIGIPLYVSENGLITSKKPPIEDSLFVARLITPPESNKQYMEALWL